MYWDSDRPIVDMFLVFTCRLKTGPGNDIITFDGERQKIEAQEFRFHESINPGDTVLQTIQRGFGRLTPEEFGTITVAIS